MSKIRIFSYANFKPKNGSCHFVVDARRTVFSTLLKFTQPNKQLYNQSGLLLYSCFKNRLNAVHKAQHTGHF
jgi:regulation of enolase protein 1 (concanavalin A-like superfamily)